MPNGCKNRVRKTDGWATIFRNSKLLRDPTGCQQLAWRIRSTL